MKIGYIIAGVVITSLVIGYFVRYGTEDRWMVRTPANGAKPTAGNETNNNEEGY